MWALHRRASRRTCDVKNNSSSILLFVKPTTHHANDPLARGVARRGGDRGKTVGPFFPSCRRNHVRCNDLAANPPERAAQPPEPQPRLVRPDGAAATD